MTYKLHPLCTLFPRLGTDELASLADDIAANGQRELIVLYQGQILDGGNRYAACLAAGVEPQFCEFDGTDPVAFVLSANLHRRHLTPGQMAMIVAAAQDWSKAQARGGDRKSPAQSATSHLDSVADRAAQSGASTRTQKRADKVFKADPKLAEKVIAGEVSLPAAVELVSPAKKAKADKAPKRELPKPVERDDTDDLRGAVQALSEDNDRLTQRLAVAAMEGTDEERQLAADTLEQLRGEVKTLQAENKAMRDMRDGYLTEIAELKKQCAYWRRKAEKAAA